jgi:hypothetical protein
MSFARSVRPVVALVFILMAACASPPAPPMPPPSGASGSGGGPAPDRGSGGASGDVTGGGAGNAAVGGSGGATAIDPDRGAADAAPGDGKLDAAESIDASDPVGVNDAGAKSDAAGTNLPLASCTQIVAAANDFVATLDAAKKATAVMTFDKRKHYLFTPEEPRPGLPLRSMTPAQQEKALALLKSSLSDSGYGKAMSIRTMDNWLKANVGGLPFGSNNYFVAIYGTPSMTGNWAWHWEGHHASIHFTFVGCTQAASTPAMFGVEPATLDKAFEGAPAGTRILGKQEDLGRALAMMLAADPQKAAKAIATKGGRMVPNTPAKQGPQNPPGLPVAMMNPAEVAKLKELIAEVVGNVNPELAAIRLGKVQAAGFDKITFFWVGPLAASRNGIYYFRVQGPTFIFEHNIEWENHIHSAWRDFDGDFGEDLLQAHLKLYPHRSAALYQDSADISAR